jgi:hypothetical protein
MAAGLQVLVFSLLLASLAVIGIAEERSETMAYAESVVEETGPFLIGAVLWLGH